MKMELKEFTQELLDKIDNHPEDFFTRQEVQRLCGCRSGTVFEYIKHGKLAAKKIPFNTPIGYKWLIAKESFRNFVLDNIKKRELSEREITKEEEIEQGYQKLLGAVFGGKLRVDSPNLSMQAESTAHLKLKQLAISLLTEKNLSNIGAEYRLDLEKGNYVLDVVGFEDDKLIAVECGSIGRKQSDFWDFFSNNKAELYWLPYNARKLFCVKYSDSFLE